MIKDTITLAALARDLKHGLHTNSHLPSHFPPGNEVVKPFQGQLPVVAVKTLRPGSLACY